MRKIKKLCTALIVVVLLLITANYISAHRHLREAISANPSNAGVSVVSYHQWLINPSTVVFDLWDVDDDISMADVTRVFLEFSSEMKGRKISRVIFAYRGDHRFYIDGDFFSELGNMSATQNPIYAIRTMPQNIKTMAGRAAFSTWSGGPIGVLSRQLDDFNNFHKQWWLEDLAQGRTEVKR